MPGERSATPKLSLPAVVSEAAASYRAYWAPLLIIAVALFAPIVLFEVLTEDVREVETGSGFEVVEAIVAALGVSVFATIGDVFYTGVVAAAVGMRREGVARDLREIARELPVLRLIAVDVLFALMVAAGFIALIVPGVIIFTWYCLTPAVVEIEGTGVRASFSRSRQLVRGNFWRVLGLLAPVMIGGDAIGEWLGESGPSLLGDGQAGEWLGGVLADVATAPLFALAAVVATHQLIAMHRGRPPG